MNNKVVKTALLSVSDKTGVVELAKKLVQLEFQILATGGTAKLLIAQGIPVIEVSNYTGFPEMLDGRVKTLHPKIYAGVLARRHFPEDLQKLAEHGISTIDLVAVNLYPFAATIAQAGVTLAEAIENVDIGGPTMVRAAAKNYQDVVILVDHQDYAAVSEKIAQNSLSVQDRFKLASKAFAHTAQYDAQIANYFTSLQDGERQEFPQTLSLQFDLRQVLRYGENNHQQAAFYASPFASKYSLAELQQHQGKELSYNNLLDADIALQCVQQFSKAACVIVKHANPCGVGQADNLLAAYQRAYATDPISAFGGIIAFNRELDRKTAAEILATQFVEVIIAPAVEPAALEVLQAKPNVRLLVIQAAASAPSSAAWELKTVAGGLLVQTQDNLEFSLAQAKCVTTQKPDPRMCEDLEFAWKVVKFVKSNAIVVVKNNQVLGIGAGQMNRVASLGIALQNARQAGFDLTGAVMASDGFFPFRDSLDLAADAKLAAVIQPGGSLKDQDVIAAAEQHQIAMLFTGMRHFKH